VGDGAAGAWLSPLCLALFAAGLWLLARPAGRIDGGPALALLLGIPPLLLAVASLAGLLPFGATRHVAVILPLMAAGVALATGRLARQRLGPVLAVALVAVPAWVATLRDVDAHNDPHLQTPASMTAALAHLRDTAPPGSVLLVDTQTRLILSRYLAADPVRPSVARAGLREFAYGGYRVVSSPGWVFDEAALAGETVRLAAAYGPDASRALIVGTSWHRPYAFLAGAESAPCRGLVRFGEGVFVWAVAAEGSPPVCLSRGGG
jgi:hypothetical protein